MFRTIELSNPDYTPPGVTLITVKAPALKRRADITCYVPPGTRTQRLPLVILLHGIYGSHWAWLHKGGAHRVLERLIEHEGLPPMMLAMPSDGLWGDGSGYVRHAVADYAEWIVNEVPAACSIAEPNIANAPRFIAGLSMGGYAALRLGAIYPDQFAAISGHSSATNLEQLFGHVEEPREAWDLQDEHPLQVLACLKANAHRVPPFRFDCGTEDFLIEPNRELHHELERAGIAHEYAEFPGTHDWTYWHEHLADSLRFFTQHLH
jgi:enterochelin esterase-like enzyme